MLPNTRRKKPMRFLQRPGGRGRFIILNNAILPNDDVFNLRNKGMEVSRNNTTTTQTQTPSAVASIYKALFVCEDID